MPPGYSSFQSKHMGWAQCLLNLERLTVRWRRLDPRPDRFVDNLQADLMKGLDETRLAAMLDWWNWRFDKLALRGTVEHPAKPTVALGFDYTSKGNLTAVWEPQGLVKGRLPLAPGPLCDWAVWEQKKGPGGRPMNELLFLRDVHMTASLAAHYKLQQRGDPSLQRRHQVEIALLQGVMALHDLLVARLALHFEIRQFTRIVMKWKSARSLVLTHFGIEDVALDERRAELSNVVAWKPRRR